MTRTRRQVRRTAIVLTVIIASCSSSGSSKLSNESGRSTTSISPTRTTPLATTPTSTTVPTEPLTATELASLRTGFNIEDVTLPTNADAWRDEQFLARLRQSRPQLLRFGGTTTMWINWETGDFVNAPDLPDQFRRNGSGRRGLTLDDYANVIKATGATPVFDLNMVTSTLDHELSMLRRAKALGMPIAFIELGNELYDPNFTRYVEQFPTGAAYGRIANTWMKGIRREFPAAKIGVAMWDAASSLTTQVAPRIRNWNRTLLSVVRGEDALVFHPYWRVDATIDPTSRKALLANLTTPVNYWSAVQRDDLALLPSNTVAWLSEWNVGLNPFRLSGVEPVPTWSHALGVAWFALATISDTRVAMSLYHDVISQSATAAMFNGAGGVERYRRTPAGEALALLLPNIASPTDDRPSTTSAVRLRPTENPMLLVAETNSPNRQLLVVNLTGQVAQLASRWSATQCSVETMSAALGQQITPDNAVTDVFATKRTTSNCDTIAIAPYSVSVIRPV